MKTTVKKKLATDCLVPVPDTLCSDDLTRTASILDDLAEDAIGNQLPNSERAAIAEVAAWLRRAAKAVEPRDLSDWDAVLALRDEREARFTNQRVAGHFGVGEATVRQASFARQLDRSKRRIVR